MVCLDACTQPTILSERTRCNLRWSVEKENRRDEPAYIIAREILNFSWLKSTICVYTKIIKLLLMKIKFKDKQPIQHTQQQRKKKQCAIAAFGQRMREQWIRDGDDNWKLAMCRALQTDVMFRCLSNGAAAANKRAVNASARARFFGIFCLLLVYMYFTICILDVCLHFGAPSIVVHSA